MPAKKAKAKTADSSGTWRWVYVIGVIVAGLAAAFPFVLGMYNQWLAWLLLVVGILLGIFYFDSDDVVNFGIRYLLLAAVGVTGALSTVPTVGLTLTNFVAGVVTFLGPIALTLLVMFFWRKYVSGEM